MFRVLETASKNFLWFSTVVHTADSYICFINTATKGEYLVVRSILQLLSFSPIYRRLWSPIGSESLMFHCDERSNWWRMRQHIERASNHHCSSIGSIESSERKAQMSHGEQCNPVGNT